MDTIFALATARGRAGVAVIRISGPDAVGAASKMMSSVPADRGLRRLFDVDRETLDEALVLHFTAGKSFTGEPVVELQLHGSIAVVNAVLRELGAIETVRPAEPGEFTRRALENGQLDLAQVEGLADLIDAETEQQRKQAVRVFSGALRTLVDGWRRDLIRALALLEATIDFADEEVPTDVTPEVLVLVRDVIAELEREVAGVKTAERLRDGFEVALIGPPNVGKSTLLNRLAGRDVAITSETAGTTRDVIEVRMDINGLPVTLLDTAGQRDATDAIEKIGVSRGVERASNADIRVHILDSDDDLIPNDGADDVYCVGKSDLKDSDLRGISGKTGDGLDWLLRTISERLAVKTASVGTAMRERHRLAMASAVEDLNVAYDMLNEGVDMVELIAAHLWSAIRAIDGIVGRVDVEDVLDEIFSSFCIGK